MNDRKFGACSKTISLSIEHPGDVDCGIYPYTDEVEIKIRSGYVGGIPGDFEQCIINAISDWYNGAKITIE